MANETLNPFDRAIGALDGLPDVISTRPTTLRVVPTFGFGTYLYAIQTFRQRDRGDTIFLEHVSEHGTTRLVIPPEVSALIARQRDQLTGRARSLAKQARRRGPESTRHRAGVREAEKTQERLAEWPPGSSKPGGRRRPAQQRKCPSDAYAR